MRIVGGSLRGLSLSGLGKGDAAAHLRPTTDRVRESLFNLLTNGRGGDLVDGAVVLDLFAGTGALGIEALSRGARHATFVDDGRTAARLLSDNIARARLGDRAAVIRRQAARIGPAPGAPATLVFLDPPYGRGLGGPALDAARAGGWLAPGATVVWEESAPPALPSWLDEIDRRRYGGTHLALARVAQEGPA